MKTAVSIFAKGRVPTPLVRLYQSNMLIHFCWQALTRTHPPKLSPHTPTSTPAPTKKAEPATSYPQQPPKTPTELERLRSDVTHLRKQVAKLSHSQPSSIPSIFPLCPPPHGHSTLPTHPCPPFQPPDLPRQPMSSAGPRPTVLPSFHQIHSPGHHHHPFHFHT